MFNEFTFDKITNQTRGIFNQYIYRTDNSYDDVLEIANLAGPNDFATYSINFSSSLKKNDIIRLEVENLTAVRDVTMGTESFMIVTEV